MDRVKGSVAVRSSRVGKISITCAADRLNEPWFFTTLGYRTINGTLTPPLKQDLLYFQSAALYGMEKFRTMLGFTKEMAESLLVKKDALKCSGKIYSEQSGRNFDIKDDILGWEMTLTMKAD